MKPFTSKEGRRGVSFEGSAEIGALAAGLSQLIDTLSSEEDPTVRQYMREAEVLRDVARHVVTMESKLTSDPIVREVQGGDTNNASTVVFDVDEPIHWQLASFGLQAAAQHNSDPIVSGVAQATHAEMVQVLNEQGLIAPPVQQPPQQ